MDWSFFSDALNFVLVGALWGVTNPLINKGTDEDDDGSDSSKQTTSSSAEQMDASASWLGRLGHEVWGLIKNWKVLFFSLFFFCLEKVCCSFCIQSTRFGGVCCDFESTRSVFFFFFFFSCYFYSESCMWLFLLVNFSLFH
jgi:hypothetical protein